MSTLPVVITVTNTSGRTTTANAIINITDSTRGLITAFNPASDNWRAPTTPTTADDVTIDGVQWYAENANKSWSVTKIDDYTVRMEVRPGDLWGDDGTARSEILTVKDWTPGAMFNANWNMTVEAGTIQTLAWCSSAQVHDGNPFVSLSLLNDKMNVLVNQTGSGTTAYQDTQNIVRGHTYAMRIQLKKSLASDGFLNIWRDGAQIVNYTGVLGSNTDNATFKLGVYEGWPTNVSAPLAIRYDHIAVDIPAPVVVLLPPLPSGPNKIGETAILADADSGNAGFLFAQKVTLASAGQVQSLSFYTTNAGGNLRMGIYNAANSKLAETASATIVSGWNTRPVVTPVNLPAGDYWIAYEVSSNATGFRVGNGSQFKGAPATFGALPAAFPAATVSDTKHWSFYMTVTV